MNKSPLLLIILFLTACGGDKETDDPGPTSKLVGSWTAASRDVTIKSGNKGYAQVLVEQWGMSNADATTSENVMKNAMTFAYTLYYPEMEMKGDSTWRAINGTQSAPGKWKMTSDEKELTLTLDASTAVSMKAAVTKLTDTDLWLEVAIDEEDYPWAQIPFDYKSVMKYTRKK